MIAPATFTPALLAARAQPINQRVDTARAGMLHAIDTFRTDSYRCWANRWADGLTALDNAANALYAGWVANNGASVPGPNPNDALVTNVLNACTGWLASRQIAGMRVTGWREQPIRDLYWRVAWCFSCDNYAQRAAATIAVNNAANVATILTEPVPAANAEGNPYNFVNCGYMHQTFNQPPRILRGDTRGPITLDAAGGFMPMNLGNRWNYAPWFAGNSTAGTISTTTTEALAIGAGPFAIANGYHLDANPPVWLANEITNARANAGLGASALRGFVYELGGVGARTAGRVATQVPGVEEVFLALPNAVITNWWAVCMDRRTVGPFPYLLAYLAPPPGANVSAAINQLA